MSERLPVGLYFNRSVPVAAVDYREKKLVDPCGAFDIGTFIDANGHDCDPEDAVILVVNFGSRGWGNVQVKPFRGQSLH